MALEIKICGLNTPEALDVALDAGADIVGFVFFPPSPRHLGFEVARALGARVRGRALKVALSVDADDEWLAAVSRRSSPTCCSFTAGDAGAGERVKAQFGLPVMKAIAVETKRRPGGAVALPRRRRPPAVRCARAARGDAAGRARQDVSTGGSCKTSTSACRSCCRAGSMPDNVARGAAHHAGARRRRVLGRRARAGREGPGEDSRLRPCRARGRGRRRQKDCEPGMTVQSNPTRSAPAPTSAGTSASTAAASSPRR